MLTIFGKKKKDSIEASLEDQTPSAPLSAPQVQGQAFPQGQGSSSTDATESSVEDQTQPQPAMRRASPQPAFRPPPPGPLPAEETSLTRLLQSLLQDISVTLGVDSGFSGSAQSTPDYVPARSTPPSRPMVIGPGKESGDWEEQDEQSVKQPTAASIGRPTKPSEAQPPSPKIPVPTPAVAPRRDQSPEKAPERPSKLEKQPEKPSKDAAPKKETQAAQGFDHIFQLTQGNLESTGFVIINGAAGSGRTTLCSGLTSNYMKRGDPCMYMTYDQSPSDLRDQMKKLGTDAEQFESQFRFIVIDGFSSQSESFSVEPYYVDQPFSLTSIQDTLVRNSQIFVGEKIRIIFDSLDGLASKLQPKDFSKGFTDLVAKLKDSGATFIVTVDLSKLPKDIAGSLNDLADCVVDLSKDNSEPDGRQLKVQRLNHSSAKVDPETFEIDSNKGLVFV